MAAMIEFLIRRDDGEWFDIDYGRVDEMLHPNSVAWQRIDGWGTYRIRVLDAEVSFSDEDPGILVVFESGTVDHATAEKLVREIATNVTLVTGQASRVVPL